MVNMDSEVSKLISAFQLSLAEIEIKKQTKDTEDNITPNKLKNIEVHTSK